MAELPPPRPGSTPASAPTTMSIGPSERQGWVERKWAARAVGAVAYLIPFLASVAAAFVLSTVLPQAPNLGIGIVRWLGIAVASTVVLVVVERQTRRLLPLRTLLGLTLAFPDQAPSRFKIAIRTGTTNQLRERLDEARRGRLGDTPSEAAERLLELVGMLSQHDRLTRGHSERVRAYSHMIGVEMGLSGRELDRLRWAGLLHDVGKLAISPDILNKPGKLTSDEFDQVKTHPMEGKALVEPLAAWLGDAARAVWEHHERFDGDGYPQGLAGNEISRAARIVSVADVFDVITSVRSYKAATSAGAAREELARCAGTQFDPDVVRAFLALSIGQVRTSMGPLSWIAQLAFLPGAVAAQVGPALATAAVVTAGAAATTVGVAADAEPVVAEREELVATVDDPGRVQDARASNAASLETDLIESSLNDAVEKDTTQSTVDAGLPTTTLDDRSSRTTDVVSVEPPPEPQPSADTTTTEPATTAASSTTTTTSSTTTTTSTSTVPVGPVDIAEWWYFTPLSAGDTVASPLLDLAADAPTADTLFNYDVDRDSAPGLLLKKDSAGVNGTDATKVQGFSLTFPTPTRITTDALRAELFVAAKDFGKKDIRVAVLVEICSNQGGCATLGVGERTVMNAERFKRVNIDLGPVDVVAAPGDRIVVRVAALDDSEDDMWLAYGTTSLGARLHFPPV